MEKKKTVNDFISMKKDGEQVAWITAYDYPTAIFGEEAGMDMLLVGDSLGMLVMGYESTVPVTMEDCLAHCRSVRRGAPNTWVIGDMLGQFKIFTPKFVKQYADIASVTVEAFKHYIAYVKEGSFPTDDHAYYIIEPQEDFESLFKEFD